MKRLVAAAVVVALAGFGCVACDNGSAPATSGAGAGDLSGVQSTLQSIQDDMAGDGSR